MMEDEYNGIPAKPEYYYDDNWACGMARIDPVFYKNRRIARTQRLNLWYSKDE